MKYKWPAPAKLNLFLYIIGRRTDGYHLLQTLFQFLDYGDSLHIIPTNDGEISLLTPITGITYEDNLVVRAAKILQFYCWSSNTTYVPGVKIYIDKVLPIGGGLGGGSSCAATVLLVLNRQWRCNLNLNSLAKLGLQLGSDVPVFIYGQASLAEGVGEILTVAQPIEKWYLVAVPPIVVSTFKIFNEFDLQKSSIYRPFDKLLNLSFYNDCELVVKKKFPIIQLYISWLSKYAPSRLTGTGACVFAEFDNKFDATRVLELSPKWMYCFISKGVNISPLHQMLSEKLDNTLYI